jgi:hypothetical protein
MMENHILITNLKKIMNENRELIKYIKEFDIRFYLFGSIFYKEKPRDIDLLMVYNQDMVNLKSIVRLKNEIVNFLHESSLIEVDLLLLSLEEELEVDFIRSEGAKNFEFFG